MAEFKVGDKITLRHYRGEIVGFATVKNAGARKITTDDGREWSVHGQRWGSERYSYPKIQPFAPEHEEHLATQELEKKKRGIEIRLREFRWAALSIGDLQRVLAIIGEPVQQKLGEER